MAFEWSSRTLSFLRPTLKKQTVVKAPHARGEVDFLNSARDSPPFIFPPSMPPSDSSAIHHPMYRSNSHRIPSSSLPPHYIYYPLPHLPCFVICYSPLALYPDSSAPVFDPAFVCPRLYSCLHVLVLYSLFVPICLLLPLTNQSWDSRAPLSVITISKFGGSTTCVLQNLQGYNHIH